jgi:2-keto-4-pentenoate hydratase/2-oxohepta-3-ene-1,7-dioic acid hydratase in catechol pathway
MKILAIGRNYVDHIHELNNEVPDEPVIFFKPDTAVLKDNAPFYHPEFSSNIHFEVEVILQINREGKYIQEKHAMDYVDGIGIGIDLTARDLQQKAKEKGLPWALAKGFNGSAPVSGFLPPNQFKDLNNLNFSLTVDGVLKQEGNTNLMIYNFESIIAYVSRFITLKKGDIIFTGTPKGVGKIEIGNKLEGFLEGQKVLECEIR